jgi:peptidoglycan/xylan/chitin deacetylase (PgdA/CDA1 family)
MIKVINFHNIRDPRWFENVIKILKSKYTLISIYELEDYYYNKRALKQSCHITTDDGDRSFYEIVFPVLNKHKIPASLFISPSICYSEKNYWFQEIRGYDDLEIKKLIANIIKIDFELIKSFPISLILKTLSIDQIWDVISIYQKIYNLSPKEPQNINVKQILEIEVKGLITIGAHTLNHPILANEKFEKSKTEIIESFNSLQDILGHKISYFAYPNGIPEIDFDKREEGILKEIGCRLAFSMGKSDINSKLNPLNIPRYGITYGTERFIQMKLILGKYWQILKELKGTDEKKLRIELQRIIFTK